MTSTGRLVARDARGSLPQLFFVLLAAVSGIAVVVAVGSFAADVDRAIDLHLQEIVGGDAVVSGSAPLSQEARDILGTLGSARVREVSFMTMARSPETGRSRLVQISAVSDGYPLFGEVIASPAGALDLLKRSGGALVDEGLLNQLGIETAREIEIGGHSLTVRGALVRAPGELAVRGLLAPRIIVPESFADESGLIKRGSRARERFVFRRGDRDDADPIVRRADLEALGLTVETLADRRRSFGRVMRDTERYLVLVGLLSIVIGTIGVATGVGQFLRRKVPDVAILRCIGATPSRTVLLFLGELAVIGLIAAFAAVLGGVAIQQLLPRFFADILPIPIAPTLSPLHLSAGFAGGFFLVVLGSLAPLLALRRISPAVLIRERSDAKMPWDPAVLAARAATAVLFVLWARALLRSFKSAIIFAGALAVLALTVTVVAAGLAKVMRHVPRWSVPYELWIGAQQVARPGSRATTLLGAIGGTAFIVVLVLLARGFVIEAIERSGGRDGPNVILFDIQEDQRDSVRALLRSEGLTLQEESPVVTMRLTEVKGVPVKSLVDRRRKDAPDWALRREYRSTYRSHLSSSEKLLAGTFVGSVAVTGGPVPVSVESGMAERLEIEIGDALTFDVQGVAINTRVGSIREVSWQRFQPNFFFVFPEGVLEDAPKFYMGATHVKSPQASASLQRRSAEVLPSVSIVDLRSIAEIVEGVLNAISAVTTLLAASLIASAMVVFVIGLAGTLSVRANEAALLKALGAGSGQVGRIAAAELFVLGVTGSVGGALAAVGAAVAIGRFASMHGGTVLKPLTIGGGATAVAALSVLAGWLVVRSAYRAGAAELLRRGT